MAKKTDPWNDPVPASVPNKASIAFGKLFGSIIVILVLFSLLIALIGLSVLVVKWLWSML